MASYARGLFGHPFKTVIAVAKFFAFAHLFTEYGFVTAPCQGPSMLPTFDILGEWILISRFHRFGRNVELGDLVAYNIPINHERGVKRILGLPGDYVLVDSPGSGSNAMIQVPQGHCWIVGDNMTASRDSRIFGPVPLALIKGKVIGRIKFPYFELIKNPMNKVD